MERETSLSTFSTPLVKPPPFNFVRDEQGLITKPVIQYVFNEEDGTINWRKMVNSKYLVPNKQLTEETDINKLDDSKLLITLAGIRNLALLRGYTEVKHKPFVATDSYIANRCRIVWLPNYETNYLPVVFEALADASPESTKGFAMNYLAAIAENRAFVRCVRNFLNIGVVGEEEVGASDSVTMPLADNKTPTPIAILQSIMDKKAITFDVLKAILIEEKVENATNFKTLEDLPVIKVYEFIERLKKFNKS